MENTENEDNKKTVIKESGDRNNPKTSGETSSLADFDTSSSTKSASRKSKSLGASHEPGVTSGTEF
jgi:hypothetical protein